MRVATFNIRHALPPGRTDVDHALVSSVVRALDADVVALQEVDRGTPRVGRVDQAALLARATGTAVHFGAAIDLDGGQYGNALLVRGTLVEVTDLALPCRGEHRQAVLARVRVADRTWSVAATHLQNARRPDEAPRQLATVLAALDQVAGADGPAVLLGDLNLGPDDVLPVLDAAGYTAADGPPTFPSHRPRERIDWIAVRGAGIGGVAVPDVQASDHRPLVAELRLPAPRPAPGPASGMD